MLILINVLGNKSLPIGINSDSIFRNLPKLINKYIMTEIKLNKKYWYSLGNALRLQADGQ